tara:strand:+ start:27 stop:482 length:456 start_codon:yes stop_codon:yes gene_type:complete
MLKKLVIIIISFFIGTFAQSEIIGKGLICELSGKPRVSNYSDIVIFFNENKEVVLNRIFRELDLFKSMKTPQITPKLEADSHEIRWICTTGCPKETYGNFVLNRKNLELRSATEKFKCEVLSSSSTLKEKLLSRVIELQKEYNDELKGNKI